MQMKFGPHCFPMSYTQHFCLCLFILIYLLHGTEENIFDKMFIDYL